MSGLSFVNLVLTLVGKISKLYSVHFTLVSKVGRECSFWLICKNIYEIIVEYVFFSLIK